MIKNGVCRVRYIFQIHLLKLKGSLTETIIKYISSKIYFHPFFCSSL
jgi:hypothetical protein